MSNDELQAVRELRPYEPSEIAVARTRRRVLTQPAQTDPAPRRWLAIAGSAVAIVGIVGLVVALQLARTPPEQPMPVGAQPSSEATPSETPTVTPTLWDMSITPAQVPEGAVLYIRNGHPDVEANEMWIDVNGGIMVMSASSGQFYAESEESVAAQQAALATAGPSLTRPTPAYLATLPNAPAALLELLTDQLARDNAGVARPDLLLKNALQFVTLVEPLLSPAQRAALLEAIDLAPGAEVDATPRTLDGHNVYLVQQREANDYIAGFIVDVDTGRILGGFAGIGQLTETNYSLATYAVVPAPGDRP